MRSRAVASLVLVGLLLLGNRAAHAQFAVIDVASLVQLMQQVQTLEQQVQTAQAQLTQARNEYAAITGSRGMQLLLSGTVRNYLPVNSAQLSQVMSGSSATFPGLAGDVRQLMSANAVLTPAQVASLSPPEQARVISARQSAALLQATARAALANSSDRFASLQQLIGAIGGASDQKASLDLNARIVAEQAMLQNEHTKLQMLYQVAQAQQVREQAIADQGSLRRLPPMGL
ncbi:MAG: type IV secretion system family protein [Gammaproteobacteria bacterium]|nr:MAG: type IV secretion system family protein [Gammaproteobacteria bacterium]